MNFFRQISIDNFGRGALVLKQRAKFLTRLERRDNVAISEEQVKHVTKLAKLAFADEELASFTDQLDKIIDMIEIPREVNTEGVLFTSNVAETVSVIRQGRTQAGWNRDELLKNVPETEDGLIRVPVIIDNGGAGA